MSETTQIIAGVDDTTKCPCIGSIFIAGVAASEQILEEWKKIGIKDSKLIAPKKREKLAKIIKETALGYTIMEITPELIDDKSLNLNDWEMLTVLTIIKKLQRQISLTKVYIDNWDVSEQRFRERLLVLTDKAYKDLLLQKGFKLNRKKIIAMNLIPEHYADENHTVVGAASILAKCASDAQYRKYKRQYGDFGSGSPADPKTRLFVWQNRHNPLPIIRTSWNTFKTILKMIVFMDELKRKQKKLPLPLMRNEFAFRRCILILANLGKMLFLY
jgi:ribonuclease HII